MTAIDSHIIYPTVPDMLLRRPEVQRVTGLSRATIYRLMSMGKFPRPRQLSENAVAWLASEITAWIASRQPVNT